ncbi:MAG TPA: PaaI family thioesterase [Burkholderiaceae bacterium]|nr:PaaI family thioesterase [Burkholderiaceae bacterium]
MTSPAPFNERGRENLPGLLGLVFTAVEPGEVRSELTVRKEHLAPNGFLHAATIVALADTSCGYGCMVNLPEGASGFTTIELKSNHLGTALEGVIDCVARPVHVGKTTQVWDATVTRRDTGRTLALFRCTQMVLYAK